MSAADWPTRTNFGTSFTGSDIQIFRAVTLAQALKLYARHKMLTTRGATPTFMLKLAAEITGVPFKRGQYLQAVTVLESWIEWAKRAPRKEAP